MSSIPVPLPKASDDTIPPSAPPALKPTHKQASKTGSHLAAGFVSGLTSSVLLQPLDLLKTRVQQQKTQDGQKSSIRGTIKNINSVKELWRGTSASAIRTSVGSALYLTLLNSTRTYLSKHQTIFSSNSTTKSTGISSALPKLSMHTNLLSGAMVRGFVGIITMPVTVVKVRYESSMYNYSSLGNAIKDIYSQHGVRGFFKGWGVTFLRDSPNAGLYVLFYELWKDVLSRSVSVLSMSPNAVSSTPKLFDTSTSALINSSSAILSAGMATTITGPFDTIKTRIQLDPVRYNSVWKSVQLIIKEEGLRGLFDGLSLRMARKAMSAGISWCIYEELVRRM